MLLLTHDDICGEFLLASGLCPKCKFHPDMQSTCFIDVQPEDISKDRAQSSFLGRYRIPYGIVNGKFIGQQLYVGWSEL